MLLLSKLLYAVLVEFITMKMTFDFNFDLYQALNSMDTG